MARQPIGDAPEGADIRAVAREMHTAVQSIQALLDDVQTIQINISALKTRVESTSEELKTINRLLRDGEGGNSVLTRLAVVESAVRDIKAAVDKFGDKVSTGSSEHKGAAVATIEAQGRWQMWTALVVGLLALAASITTAIKTKGP